MKIVNKRKVKFNFQMVVFVFLVFILIFGCSFREAETVREKARSAGLRLRHRPIGWEKAVEFNFDSAEILNEFIVVEGEWEIRGGRLCAVKGERNRAVLLSPGFPGPVRIEVDVVNYASGGLLGDITVLINASPDKDYFRSGYALTTGSYWNTLSTFYKKGAAIANTSWSPVVSGRENLIAVEFNDGHIRYELNGKRILEAWEEDPLVISEEKWLGIRTWNTLMCVDRIAIYRGREEVD